jgi:hypothetical protein
MNLSLEVRPRLAFTTVGRVWVAEELVHALVACQTALPAFASGITWAVAVATAIVMPFESPRDASRKAIFGGAVYDTAPADDPA